MLRQFLGIFVVEGFKNILSCSAFPTQGSSRSNKRHGLGSFLCVILHFLNFQQVDHFCITNELSKLPSNFGLNHLTPRATKSQHHISLVTTPFPIPCLFSWWTNQFLVGNTKYHSKHLVGKKQHRCTLHVEMLDHPFPRSSQSASKCLQVFRWSQKHPSKYTTKLVRTTWPRQWYLFHSDNLSVTCCLRENFSKHSNHPLKIQNKLPTSTTQIPPSLPWQWSSTSAKICTASSLTIPRLCTKRAKRAGWCNDGKWNVKWNNEEWHFKHT